MPKVSICVPAFNQTVYLQKTIQSVLKQSYTDYELIVSDDSTTDAVRDLVNAGEWRQQIRYVRNSRPLGTPENWNEALRHSSGQYIKILHHDDWFSSAQSLGRYVAMLDRHPETDFAFSATRAVTPGAGERDHFISQTGVELLKKDPLLLYRNNVVGAPSTVIFRRQPGLFFDNRLKWLVDIDFYIRLIGPNRAIQYTNEFLVVTCEPEGRVSTDCKGNREVEVREYLLLLQKIFRQKKVFGAAAVRSCLLKAIEVLDHHGVASKEDLQSCGYHGGLSGELQTYLRLKASAPILARGYKKVLRQPVRHASTAL